MSESVVARKGSRGPSEAPSDVLLALAERCEREEPGWVLDMSIGEAAFGVLYGTAGAPRYTASLDAAVRLIADGVEWYVSNLYAVARAEVGLNLSDRSHYGEHKGGLIPMALCAAALRARAAVADVAGPPSAESASTPSPSGGA